MAVHGDFVEAAFGFTLSMFKKSRNFIQLLFMKDFPGQFFGSVHISIFNNMPYFYLHVLVILIGFD